METEDILSSLQSAGLPMEQKFVLADALLDLPAMSTMERRQEIVRELNKAVASSIHESTDARGHVLAILDACLDHFDGLGPLFEVLRHYYRDTRQFAALLRTVDAIQQELSGAVTISAAVVTDTVSIIPRFGVTSGPMSGASEFYIRRRADSLMEQAIQDGERSIVLRGERSGGMTSLLDWAHERAQAGGARVVVTDLNEIRGRDFRNLESFWKHLCFSLIEELSLDGVDDNFWNAAIPPSFNMSRFLNRQVLAKVREPILWSVLQTDRLFFQETEDGVLASEVFRVFRSWFGNAASDPDKRWIRLRLLISSTLDPAHFISDGKSSPYNVGQVISLDDFTLEETVDLNRQYGGPLRNDQEQKRFREFFGGIPALCQLGLRTLVETGWDYARLEQAALGEVDGFGAHLRYLLVPLNDEAIVGTAARELVQGRPCQPGDVFLRLRSLGVVRGSTHREAHIRCDLYRRFLASQL